MNGKVEKLTENYGSPLSVSGSGGRIETARAGIKELRSIEAGVVKQVQPKSTRLLIIRGVLPRIVTFQRNGPKKKFDERKPCAALHVQIYIHIIYPSIYFYDDSICILYIQWLISLSNLSKQAIYYEQIGWAEPDLRERRETGWQAYDLLCIVHDIQKVWWKYN